MGGPLSYPAVSVRATLKQQVRDALLLEQIALAITRRPLTTAWRLSGLGPEGDALPRISEGADGRSPWLGAAPRSSTPA